MSHNAPANVLIVLTNLDWLGVARAPQALARVGFKVHVFGPTTHAIMTSRFIDQRHSFDSPITIDDFKIQLSAIIIAQRPKLILPGDDQAASLLHLLRQQAPVGSDLQTALDASLPPAQYHHVLEQKSRQTVLAEQLGIYVPPSIINPNPDAALAFAAACGYPVLIKLDHSWAGHGITRCPDETTLIAALRHVPQASRLYPVINRTLQAYIPGTGILVTFAAHRGTLLESFTMTKMVQTEFGPTTVAAIREDEATINEPVRLLIEALGMNGFGDVDFQLEEGTGRPYFIEMNPRWVPTLHLGRRLQRDLIGSLANAIGITSPDLGPINGPIKGPVAMFPNELFRDQHSRYLHEAFHDVPWDEPDLIAHIIGSRNRN
jgi:carbamoylphosphate synthase large subunit